MFKLEVGKRTERNHRFGLDPLMMAASLCDLADLIRSGKAIAHEAQLSDKASAGDFHIRALMVTFTEKETGAEPKALYGPTGSPVDVVAQPE